MRGLILVAFVVGLLGLTLANDLAAGQLRRPKTVVQAQPAPQPVEKVGDGKIRERILLAVVRSKVIDKLVADGLDGRKFKDRAEAAAFYDQLGDDVVKGAVKEASPKAWEAIGEGGFLAKLVQWIRDHPEEVAAIIKLILSLLALL